MGFKETIANLFKRKPNAPPQQIIKEAEKAGIPPAVAVAEVKKEGMRLKQVAAGEKTVLQQEIALLKTEEKQEEIETEELKKVKQYVNLAHAKMLKAQELLYRLEKIIDTRCGYAPGTKVDVPRSTFNKQVGEEHTFFTTSIDVLFKEILIMNSEMVKTISLIKKEALIDAKLKAAILSNIKSFEQLYSAHSGAAFFDRSKVMEAKKIFEATTQQKALAQSKENITKQIINQFKVMEQMIAKLESCCSSLELHNKNYQLVITLDSEPWIPNVTPVFRNRVKQIVDGVFKIVKEADADFHKGLKLLLQIEKLDEKIDRDEERSHSAVVRVMGGMRGLSSKPFLKQYAGVQ